MNKHCRWSIFVDTQTKRIKLNMLLRPKPVGYIIKTTPLSALPSYHIFNVLSTKENIFILYDKAFYNSVQVLLLLYLTLHHVSTSYEMRKACFEQIVMPLKLPNWVSFSSYSQVIVHQGNCTMIILILMLKQETRVMKQPCYINTWIRTICSFITNYVLIISTMTFKTVVLK